MSNYLIHWIWIDLKVSENEVKLLFAQYGNVVSVKIINDRAGVPRGYRFLFFTLFYLTI
jgi:RNA recognition motif-containing protein